MRVCAHACARGDTLTRSELRPRLHCTHRDTEARRGLRPASLGIIPAPRGLGTNRKWPGPVGGRGTACGEPRGSVRVWASTPGVWVLAEPSQKPLREQMGSRRCLLGLWTPRCEPKATGAQIHGRGNQGCLQWGWRRQGPGCPGAPWGRPGGMDEPGGEEEEGPGAQSPATHHIPRGWIAATVPGPQGTGTRAPGLTVTRTRPHRRQNTAARPPQKQGQS